MQCILVNSENLNFNNIAKCFNQGDWEAVDETNTAVQDK